MKITLIRHSKTIFQPEVANINWVLSDAGIELAKEFANKPEIASLDIIYSSLQNKAIETAVLLAKPHNIPLRFDDRFTETTSLTNAFIEDFDKFIHDYHTGVIANMNGGETKQQVLKRFLEGIEDLEQKYPDKNIGIVSHGNALSIVSEHFSDKSSLEMHHLIQMPDIATLDWKTKRFLKEFAESN